jgi:hypothetical protein
VCTIHGILYLPPIRSNVNVSPRDEKWVEKTKMHQREDRHVQ